MTSEAERFLALSKASQRLIWEIYQSRNRSPREALLILLDHSKIVKDYRKSLGLGPKTLDLPIRMLFSEIAKNHSTYLDKDVKTKPEIVLDTGFLMRLPPLPPDFAPPDDVPHNDDVSMNSEFEDEGDQKRSMKRDNTHMSPQAKHSKKKKTHADDTATRPSTPAEDVEDEPPARATRSRSSKTGGSKGTSAQGTAESKGRVGAKDKGKGKEKEKEVEQEEEEQEDGQEEEEEDGVPVQQEPPAPGSGFEVTDEPCALCVFTQQKYCWRPGVYDNDEGDNEDGDDNQDGADEGDNKSDSDRDDGDEGSPCAVRTRGIECGRSVVQARGIVIWGHNDRGTWGGMPAGTAIDTSGFAKGNDLELTATAVHDLQADVYDIRGQLQAKIDTDGQAFGNIDSRLEQLEGDMERVQEDLTTFTTDIDDLRGELQDLRTAVPSNPKEMERISRAIENVERRVGEQQEKFSTYQQKAKEKLRTAVQSAVSSEVKKMGGGLEERLHEKWEGRTTSLEENLGVLEDRLSELEGQQASEMEQRLEGQISKKVNHLFKAAEGRLEEFVKSTIGKESKRLEDSQVDPTEVAKSITNYVEQHWPSLLTPILSDTLEIQLKDRIGDVDANIVRVGDSLAARLRSLVQEEIARVSHDLVREAVLTTMRNLTVAPSLPQHQHPPYPSFIDPDLFEQAFEPILLSSPQRNHGTSISSVQFRDPSGSFRAGLQDSVLTAVPDGVSSVRARPTTRDRGGSDETEEQ
ncbi:hypothetical protein CC1G_15157 [Coprinopsis cinerea okayama7|uniref:Uncharacterized protein n=1 Tax=Coprinopsis cinerea (strain Okayama-7 / 130 / ATCC MYA-4618 / FGSC 9003) TaxID=240176 RepID=D6RPS4_COPC7|nr:hypothetical protein CC1G_15157 [Coprinopsis cinerea okayama7\|eukprot:XP_002910518.1 hypothetical protein CC1G_15157 [Coprinopsis cinerea okayama7\